MAVGLGSMDMPMPAVAEWEWLNWKFPRAVHAGETIYARWTLTQKRAPVGGAPTAIVVWRVDVHTADGALCAEGEVGASVTRRVASARARATEPAVAAIAKAGVVPESAAATATAPATARRRRGRRRPASDGAKNPVETKAAHVTEVALVAAPAAIAAPERSAGGTRRRRRRRSPASAQARNGDGAAPAASIEAPSAPPPVPAAPTGTDAANPLTRVMRRLRRSST